jgi:hypothetical protein
LTGLATTLADYVTNSSLTTTLADYVTNSSLTTNLASYLTTASAAGAYYKIADAVSELALKANLASPTFTGTLTAPTINASSALQVNGNNIDTIYQPISGMTAISFGLISQQ